MGNLWERIVNSQPTLSQTLPGMQHPPPKLSGQSISSSGQPDTSSPQTCPGLQHPTSPSPVSVVSWQTRPAAQQLYGRFIEAQSLVPPGHEKLRVSRAKIASGDRSRRLKRGWVSSLRSVCREKGACSGCGMDALAECSTFDSSSRGPKERGIGLLLSSSSFNALSDSTSNCQYSGKNISPWSPLIFRTAIGT